MVFNHRYFSDPRSLPWGDIVELDKVRLIIPASELMANKQNVVDILETSFQSNRKRYVDMIRYIENVSHLYSYSYVPHLDLVRFDTRAVVDPRDDAFTFGMKTLLRRLCKNDPLSRNVCA